jgi:hypothetical protein
VLRATNPAFSTAWLSCVILPQTHLVSKMLPVLEFVPEQAAVKDFWLQMGSQMLRCTACIEQYHASKNELRATFQADFTGKHQACLRPFSWTVADRPWVL